MSTSKQVDLLLEEEEMLLMAACLQLQIVQKPKRKRKERIIWTRSWLQRRVFLGHYEKLVAELSGEDLRGYFIIIIFLPYVIVHTVGHS